MSATYRFVRLLGRGGMGSVYEAVECEAGFERTVAVKVLDGHAPSAEILARFRDEARLGSLVRDRAFVRTALPRTLGGRWVVVMERIEGVSLDRVLVEGKVPPRPALEIVAECARALHAAASATSASGAPLGFVHRDIKPGNVMVTASGEVRILDLGIAQASFAGREAETREGAVPGTPGYIAPERLNGVVSPAGDIYALGTMLAAMVELRMGAAAPVATLTSPSVTDGPPVSGGAPYSPLLSEVLSLAKAMQAPEPSERPSAREAERRASALALAVGGPPLRDWAEGALRVSLPIPDPDDPWLGRTVGEADEGRRPRVPRWGWAAGLAAVGLALLGWAARAPSVPSPAAPPPVEAAVAAPPPVPLSEVPPSPVSVAPSPEPAPSVSAPPARAPAPEAAVWVKTRPYGEVRVGASRWDTEDPGMRLPPGRHLLRLSSYDGRYEASWTVRVSAGAENSFCWDFEREGPCSLP